MIQKCSVTVVGDVTSISTIKHDKPIFSLSLSWISRLHFKAVFIMILSFVILIDSTDHSILVGTMVFPSLWTSWKGFSSSLSSSDQVYVEVRFEFWSLLTDKKLSPYLNLFENVPNQTKIRSINKPTKQSWMAVGPILQPIYEPIPSLDVLSWCKATSTDSITWFRQLESC